MKKWIIIASLVLMICFIGIIGYLGVLGNNAPAHVSYYGKPLTYWFQPWRTPIDSIKVSADISLPQPGRGDFNPEAIPFLVKNLHYRQPFCGRLSQRVWHSLPIPAAKRSSWLQPVPDETMRRNARDLLRLSKYAAGSSVPVLLNEYQKGDGAVKAALASVLGEIGGSAREAHPVLRGSLLSPDVAERTAAEKAVAQIESGYTPTGN